jgi:hypothetical protein
MNIKQQFKMTKKERVLTIVLLGIIVGYGAFQVAYGTNEGMQIISHVQNATIGSSGQYNIPNSTAHINGPPGTKLNNITILESPN